MIMGTKKQAGICMAAILLGLLLFLDTALAAGSAEVLTGVTMGQEKIQAQDIPRAKQKAVNNALEVAVQNAVASLVSRQVFAGNLEFLYENILPRSSDYVTTYRVIGGWNIAGIIWWGLNPRSICN